MTVSPSAVAAIQAAAAGGIQGAGLGPPLGTGNSFTVIASDPAVVGALGASSVATSVAQICASGTLASHSRLGAVRYFAPGGIQSWK